LRFGPETVQELLAITPQDRICDLGSGNGDLSQKIASSLEPVTPIICVEPNVEMSAKINNKWIIHKTQKAEEFVADCETAGFDKIIIKQAIHHFTSLPQSDLAELMFRMLSQSGKVLVLVMPPTIEYPTFEALRTEFGKSQVDFTELELNFSKAGFTVSRGYRDYPVRIGREEYFQAIRTRYISTLAAFSEAEIENGIHDLRTRSGGLDRYEFCDRLWFFLMSKPVLHPATAKELPALFN
jgi:cyclopropane fatty-acyl-phospholipid synthase-like methyltransferase